MRQLIFVLLLCCGQLSAQQGPDAAAPGIPRLTLKLNASVLLNPFKQALAFDSDIRLAPRFSLDAGGGVFIGSPMQFAQHKGESYKGLRLRAGLKYYLLEWKRSAFHVGLAGKYHDIKHISIREIFRQGQQYLEYYPVERHIRTFGLAGRAGWQLYFGRHKRFLLEPYAGVGALYNHVTSYLPPDADEFIGTPEWFTFEYATGKHRTIDLLVGLHVGVGLW